MNRLFGSGSGGRPKASLSDAIASTDTRIDGIEVKIRKCDNELARYRDQMKRLKDGPGKVRTLEPADVLTAQAAVQKRALNVLKQRKMYEGQLDKLQQQTFNMEQAAMTTDNLRNTMATVDAMKAANKEMKRQYGKIDIDKIEAIHYDMADLIEQANEIQESMSRTYGVPEDVDEMDLEAELAALGDEVAAEREGEVPSYLRESSSALPDFVDEAPVEGAKAPAQAAV